MTRKLKLGWSKRKKVVLPLGTTSVVVEEGPQGPLKVIRKIELPEGHVIKWCVCDDMWRDNNVDTYLTTSMGTILVHHGYKDKEAVIDSLYGPMVVGEWELIGYD